MKALCILVFIGFIFQSSVMSQIKQYITDENIEIYSPPHYDTTHNFKYHRDERDYKMYIGQKLYFFPLTEKGAKEATVSKDFKLHKPQIYWINSNKRRPKKDIDYKERYHYGWNLSDRVLFYTPPEAIFGKYFIIINCFENNGKLYLTLHEENETILFDWEIDHWNLVRQYPCILVSFYEKTQQEFVDNDFHIINKYFVDEKIKSLNSNKILHIKGSSSYMYKCVDIGMIENGSYYVPALIFQDQEENKFPVRILPEIKATFFSIFNSHTSQRKMININNFESSDEFYQRKIGLEQHFAEKERQEKEHRKMCISRFGEDIGNTIADKKVQLGMTSEMCEIAWGKPDRINSTTSVWGTSEQWVYDSGSYLYFNNGKLTSIQN